MKINVTITPNARVSAIVKLDESNYKIKVDAPATEGRANTRLVELLAEYFNVSKSSIRIIRGLKSRGKVVEVCR